MKVHLTFDVEVWCNDWTRLDERFPAAFRRYVYGQSAQGEYALPKTLEIMARHGLQGVFFVEPLFAARFGVEHLQTIIALIRQAGQDVQLHLHPEWVDELPAPPIADHHTKRQHLCHYTADEQAALIAYGIDLHAQAGGVRPSAFRAGSFACNRDTFHALQSNGIAIDSSLDACTQVSGADLREAGVHLEPAWIDGVFSVPVTTFQDGLGRRRSAQINGSSFAELVQALESSAQAGASDFVLVSHNFEMLKPGTSEPDSVVVRRFENLCAYLARNRSTLQTDVFRAGNLQATRLASTEAPVARATLDATAIRFAEQLWRRF